MSDQVSESLVGAVAPDFELRDMEGQTHRLSDYRGQIVVLNFWSAECPVSEAFDPYFSERADGWRKDGIVLLAIDSNSHYDDDAIRRVAQARGVRFPILRDHGNRVADLYGALTTPHVYVIDREGIVRYQGAVDDRTFRKRVPEVNYLDQVLSELLEGKPLTYTRTEPFGCTIVRVME